MGVTKHYLWVLGREGGERFNYEKTDVVLDLGPRQFDHDYICTIGANNGGHIRYQILPAHMHGHRVDTVSHYVSVQDDTDVEIWSGNFHCVDCGLTGTTETMRSYSCVRIEKAVGSDLEGPQAAQRTRSSSLDHSRQHRLARHKKSKAKLKANL